MNQPHKNLEVWKKGIGIAKLIYQVTEKFPKDEKFDLIAQKYFSQFLHNAQGSLIELDTRIIIAHELGFIKNEERESIEKELAHENKMLTGLMKSLRNRNTN